MSSESKQRLDQALVARGLSPSRARSKDLIDQGFVSVNDTVVRKVAQMVQDSDHLAVSDAAGGHVSRAAAKLVAALEGFGIDVAGCVCLDIGASTGGFTQVLMERGAEHVIAIDVGRDQMHPAIAALPGVTVIEGLNARDLDLSHLRGAALELIVSDVSFISLKLALPRALHLASPGTVLVALIKPQFEAGRDNIGKGGIVRDEAVRERVCEDIQTWLAQDMGWQVLGMLPSPVTGSDGNQEYLIAARKP